MGKEKMICPVCEEKFKEFILINNFDYDTQIHYTKMECPYCEFIFRKIENDWMYLYRKEIKKWLK